MPKYITIILCWLLSVTASLAQSLELKCSGDKIVVGDRITLQYSLKDINGDIENIQISKMPDGIRILGGISISKLSSIINGKVAIEEKLSIQLVAEQVGTYKIGSASILINGKTYTCQSKSISINSSPGTINPNDKIQELPPVLRGKIQLTSEISPKTTYIGQAVWVRYYQKTKNISLFEQTLGKIPEYQSFWLEQQRDILSQTKIEGDWSSILVRKDIVYPQKTGELIIDELEVKGRAVEMTYSPNSIDLNSDQDVYEFTLATKPTVINVKPLPIKGKPINFSGLVGDIVISAQVDRQTALAHEPIILKVTVSGEGCLALYNLPKLKLSSTIEVINTGTSTQIDRTGQSTSGIKTFTYTLIQHEGTRFEIPELTLNYFNVNTEKYVELKTEAIPITVGQAIPDKQKEYLELQSKLDADANKKGFNLLSVAKYLLYIIVLAFLVILFYLRRMNLKGKKKKTDPQLSTVVEHKLGNKSSTEKQQLIADENIKPVPKPVTRIVNSENDSSVIGLKNILAIEIKKLTRSNANNIFATQVVQDLINAGIEIEHTSQIAELYQELEKLSYNPIQPNSEKLAQLKQKLNQILINNS